MRLTIFAAMLAAATPIQAGEDTAPAMTEAAPVTADVEQIAKLMADEGYQAKVESDEKGDRYIRSASGGRNFSVYFLGCSAGLKIRSCDSIEFYTGFTLGKPFPPARTDEWNSKSRYGRAYVDSEKDPVVEMDLYLDAGGMPRALFVKNMNIWFDVMANFDEFVFDDGDEDERKK